MDDVRLLLLLQLVAILYLIYRVHRLEQATGTGGGRPVRRAGRGESGGKVVPLLKDDIPPGPFRPKPGSSDSEGKN